MRGTGFVAAPSSGQKLEDWQAEAAFDTRCTIQWDG